MEKYEGISGGEEAGKRGFMMTFVVTYIRDIVLEYRVFGESFETFCPWDNVLTLYKNVMARIKTVCKEQGCTTIPMTSMRVTQLYETGAALYFYYGYRFDETKDVLKSYSIIEQATRDEVLKWAIFGMIYAKQEEFP